VTVGSWRFGQLVGGWGLRGRGLKKKKTVSEGSAVGLQLRVRVVLAAVPKFFLARLLRCFASPLKWLLNGGARAAPGLGTPLDEPNRGHDD
jgi:hypothetical protein